MNKKAALGNQLHLFSFFFLLLVVAGTVVIGYSIYIGKGYDSRQIASNELGAKAVECLNADSLNENYFNICGFDKKVLEKEGFIVRVCEEKCTSAKSPEIFVGSNYQACDINAEDKSYPKCFKTYKEINGKKYEVIVGTNRIPRSAT